MIDTIVLALSNNMYSEFERSKFTPITIHSGARYFRKWVRNPSKEEIHRYGYMPRLTLIDRPSGQVLNVEFSAPKLLFSNNIEELEDADFDEVVTVLQAKLKIIGIYVFGKLMVNVPVAGIHYSKNFLLTDGYTPSMYIDLIQKSDTTLRYDVSQTDYRTGHGIKYHTNTFELAFYDKLQDLKQNKISDKRCFEKDNAVQLDLFDSIYETKKLKRIHFEILRMEIRLNNKQKIKQVLKKIDVITELTFSKLFNSSISQKILLSYFDEIADSLPTVIDNKDQSAKQFIGQFRMNNPKASMSEILCVYGFYEVINDIGMRELRSCFENTPYDKWYRFKKKLTGYTYPKCSYDVLNSLKQQLQEFKAITHVDFPDGMLNNDKDN